MIQSCLLLVEDNPDDVFIMRRALKKAQIDLPLFVAPDGKQALDFLRGESDYADRGKYPLPSVVFLDLKLPYFTGFEVLEQIRERPLFSDLNVVILTSSGEDRDRKRACELGAKAYLVKPPEPKSLLELLKPFLQPPMRALAAVEQPSGG